MKEHIFSLSYLVALRTCKNEQDIDRIFNEFGVMSDDYRLKSSSLKIASGETQSFDCYEDDFSDKDRYQEDLAFFLEGAWRMFLLE